MHDLSVTINFSVGFNTSFIAHRNDLKISVDDSTASISLFIWNRYDPNEFPHNNPVNDELVPDRFGIQMTLRFSIASEIPGKIVRCSISY